VNPSVDSACAAARLGRASLLSQAAGSAHLRAARSLPQRETVIGGGRIACGSPMAISAGRQ